MAIIEFQVAIPRLLSLLSSGTAVRIGSLNGRQFTTGRTAYVIKRTDTTGAAVLVHSEPIDQVAFYRSYMTHPDGTNIWSNVIPSHKVQFTQGISISLLRKNYGPLGNVTSVSDAGTIDFQLTYCLRTGGGNPSMLVFEVEKSSDMGGDPNVALSLRTLIATAIPPSMTPLPVGSFPSTAIIGNSGVAVDIGGNRVAIRVEIGYSGDDDTTAWRQFYAEQIADHMNVGSQGGDFSLFLDYRVVEEMVKQSFEAGLAIHTGEFRKKGGLSAIWAPDNGRAVVNVAFTGDAINACLGTWDISFDVTSRVEFSIAPGSVNTLEARSHSEWNGSASDEVFCELAVGFTLGFLGGGIGQTIGGPFGVGIGACAGFWTGFIGAIIVASTYTPQFSNPNCTTAGSDVTCDRPLSVPTNPLSNLPLISFDVAGAPDGLVVFGGLNVAQMRVANVQPQLAAGDFRWKGPLITCANIGPGRIKGLGAHPQGYAHASAEVDVTNTGTGALVVLSVERVSPDPDNVFPPTAISIINWGSSTSIDIDTNYDAAYAAAPYPLDLLVITNGGADIVTVPAIPPLDADALANIELEAASVISKCKQKANPWWLTFERVRVEWLVDPGPEGRIARKYLVVEVEGTMPGDAIRGDNEAGNSLGIAVSGSRRVARLVLAPDSNDLARGIAIGRVENGARERTSNVRTTIQQAEIVRQGELQLAEPLLAVDPVRSGSTDGVVALSEHGLWRLDMFDFRHPRILGVSPLEGYTGIASVIGQLLVWGEAGVLRVSDDGLEVLTDVPSRGVAGAGGVVAFATSDQIELRDQNFRLLSSLDMRTIGLSATSRSLVALAASGELVSLAVSDSARLEPVASWTAPSQLTGISTSDLLRPRSSVLGLGERSSYVVDWADARSPELLGEYMDVSWYRSACRFGPSVIRVDPASGAIEIEAFGRTVLARDLQTIDSPAS